MTERMTKRTLLRGVGAAAGVGAVYRTMRALGVLGVPSAAAADLPAPVPGSGRGTRVVILGAGIAGMTAAYRLSRAGYECVVLEATGRAGGRSLTVRAGDRVGEDGHVQDVDFDREPHLYANLGPGRIPHHHRAVLGYCREFGIPLEVFTNDNRAAYFHDSGSFGGLPIRGRRIVTDTRGYVAELLAKAVARDSLDTPLTEEDRERILAMLVEYGDLDPDRLYRGSARAGHVGDHVHAGLVAGEKEAPLDLSELLRADFWQYKLHFGEFLDQNPTLLQPVGGMDALAGAFLERVKEFVRYRCEVTEIRRTSEGGAWVGFRRADGTVGALDADFVVCTIPAPVLRDIPADFSPEVRDAIAGIAFVPAVKVALQARRRFWEEDDAIYGGISWTDQDITQIWYPPYGYQKAKGILIGAYPWDDGPCERLAAMAPERRLEKVLAEGDPIHPGYAAEIENGVSLAWGRRPFQKGAWPKSYVAPPVLQRPDGPFLFAGDQVTALPGWQEGAVLAAHAAVHVIDCVVRCREGARC